MEAATIANNFEENCFELMDSLYSAVAEGDIKKFEQHAQVLDQITTPNGNTILHIHITARSQKKKTNDDQQEDFVREMVEMCPNLLWKPNKKGETLLHMAARHGHADIVETLLAEGQKGYHNHDQEHGITATRRMLQTTSYEAKDTALHEAVRYNHIDVVKMLMKEGPDLPYEANNTGETPLYLAAERGYTRILEEILRTCVSSADHGPNGRTALHAAVICNDEEMIKLLLVKKRNLNSKPDQQGWIPLHLAAHFGHLNILKKLLVDKSTAYKADNEGKTALHVAAGLGKVNIMQELISSCPGCCELVDRRGRNVLHFALESRNRKAIKLVLENPFLGNLINEKDENGNTPFLQAASMDSNVPYRKVVFMTLKLRDYLEGFYMSYIINHPKVDKLVFNRHNHNAADIIVSANKFPWIWHESSLWLLENHKVNPSMRILASNEVEEDNNNALMSNNKSIADVIKEARQKELLAATLISTVTFASGLTVPGGFITDKNDPSLGAPILEGRDAFEIFLGFNSMALVMSSLAVLNHLFPWADPDDPDRNRALYKQWMIQRSLILCAMVTMILAFLSGTYAALYSNQMLAIKTCITPFLVVASIGYSASISFKLSKLSLKSMTCW